MPDPMPDKYVHCLNSLLSETGNWGSASGHISDSDLGRQRKSAGGVEGISNRGGGVGGKSVGFISSLDQLRDSDLGSSSSSSQQTLLDCSPHTTL